MRQLSELEERRLALLTSISVDLALIQPTETALKKSIMDATAPVRRYLLDNGLHDYANQGQGPSHKQVLPLSFLTNEAVLSSKASLYRPETKAGDPRIWFSGLSKVCQADDIIGIIAHAGRLFALNITRISIEGIIENTKKGPIWDVLSEIEGAANSVADELLAKLREISAAGLARSVMEHQTADTAIGRTLETLLGIPINSSKQPDYRGIELKSFRAKKKGRENRKTLFAQVANWRESQFKSSREILDAFGYHREEDFKLYCTVSTKVRNSQGLQFKLDDKAGKLIENSDRVDVGDFAVWFMDDLRTRLAEKHNETFWVSARSQIVDGKEHFHFTKALHTRKPILSQFDFLVERGTITMDHLIKKNTRGKVSEKGPLFKVDANSLELLFPPAREYDLCV